MRKQIPRTIENAREYDETVVQDHQDEDVQVEEQSDPFAGHYNKVRIQLNLNYIILLDLLYIYCIYEIIRKIII